MDEKHYQERFSRIQNALVRLENLGVRTAERIIESEHALSLHGDRIKKLEHIMAIMVEMKARGVERSREHEEWLKRHEGSMREFDEKMSALIKIISKQQGGIESE